MKAKIRIDHGIPVHNLTPGKEYEVTDVIEESKMYGKLFNITDDEGEEIQCLEKECGYLHGGEWEIIE